MGVRADVSAAAQTGPAAQQADHCPGDLAGLAPAAPAVDREGRGVPPAGADAPHGGRAGADSAQPGAARAAGPAQLRAVGGPVLARHHSPAPARAGSAEAQAAGEGRRPGRLAGRTTGSAAPGQADPVLEREGQPGIEGDQGKGDLSVLQERALQGAARGEERGRQAQGGGRRAQRRAVGTERRRQAAARSQRGQG